jgi:uncharacterized protein (TIGR01732 family)
MLKMYIRLFYYQEVMVMSDKRGHGCNGSGAGFALIVVLFILLIIVGAAWL